MLFSRGLKEELSGDVKARIVQHKARFYYIFTNRYFEILPSLISYKYSEDDKIAIDFLELEHALRRGKNVAVGLNAYDKLVILGFINTPPKDINSDGYFINRPLDADDIDFIIPKDQQKQDYKEITSYDNYTSGNFVVLKNKLINVLSDYEIIEHYGAEVAEINNSRFSLTLQAKVITVFVAYENENETLNQLVSDIYNGAPYVKIDRFFDPEDNIIQLNNAGLAQSFTELKREYQNKVSELNTMLGIDNLGVEKTSGVSDLEAKGSESYTNVNANIYLASRNKALKALNKRYSLDIKAMYNDDVASELKSVQRLGENIEDNNDATRDFTSRFN